MSRESSIVVLFDVDGTLIRTEGHSPHGRAFRAAFQRVFGTECRFTQGMHGMTDLQIFVTLAEEMGVANGQIRDLAAEACRRMVQIYQERADNDGSYVALPGVQAVVETLQRRGALLGLVTGNAPEIALDKLTSAGLADFFRFGAYGTESVDRGALPPLAIARGERLIGRTIERRDVFVVGDTPRDVACAVKSGCRAVAVATGNIPMDQLVGIGAELVLPDLMDPDPLLALVGT